MSRVKSSQSHVVRSVGSKPLVRQLKTTPRLKLVTSPRLYRKLLMIALGSTMLFGSAAREVSASITPSPGEFQRCPEQGWGGDPEQNVFKNRSYQVSNPRSMTVAEINALPVPGGIQRKDRHNWPTSALKQATQYEIQGAVVTGYLVYEAGKAPSQSVTEASNCNFFDQRDYHVWLVDYPNQSRAKSIMAEVTPRWRAGNIGWSLTNLINLAKQGAKVRITGWLMLESGNPEQIGKTRGSLWELHPITKIEVFANGKWVEL